MNKPTKKKRKVLMRILKYMSEFKAIAITSLLLVVIGNLLELVGPKLAGKAIDAIGIKAGGVNFGLVFRYVILMLVCYLISAILSYVLSYLTIKLSRKMMYKMRCDVFDNLTRLPVSFFDSRKIGDIISVISYDIDTVNSSVSSDVLQICKTVITVTGALIMMITIAPVLVLIFAVTVPLSVFFTRYITKKVQPLFRKRSKKLGELNGYVEEMLEGHKTTKAYHSEEEFIKRFDKKNKEAIDAYTNSEYFGAMVGPSVNFINNISLAAVSVFGALLYLHGMIGIGDVSAFVLYSRRFSGPINEAANIVGELQSAFAAAERVFALIDELPEKPDSSSAEILRRVYGNVKLENVNFGYDEDEQIIKNLNIEAPKGKMVAIVGKTGAGKTTIINMLMRFYDVDSGKITVDGKDICTVTRESLRRAYTMVLQDTWLFNGTVFENIAYGKSDATREEVINAAKAAKIHEFITALPHGYDTVLAGDGVNISKGQKQMLTIARAMLIDSRMLILDEATSNVDTRTEEKIQEAMLELMKDKTCFVIAHRLSTVKNADLIIVMNNGEAVEQGTHNELLKKNGYYAKLYNSQFEEY